jgi:AhpD family alkylhydroperoxidase
VAHVELGNENPGIRGLLASRPETAEPIMQLAEVLLRGDSTLTRGERELIAAYVSRLNECAYCAGSHGASAAALLPGGTEQVEQTLAGPACDAPVPGKLRALLDIAGLVKHGYQVLR